MSDLTSEELDRLYDGSKDDGCIIVGSEVRQMIGMIRRSKDAVFQAKVEAAYELAAEISKSKQLEAALREIAIYNDNITKTIREALAPEQEK